MALWGAPRRKKNGAPGGIALKPCGEGCQKSTSSGGPARCSQCENQPKSVLAMKPADAATVPAIGATTIVRACRTGASPLRPPQAVPWRGSARRPPRRPADTRPDSDTRRRRASLLRPTPAPRPPLGRLTRSSRSALASHSWASSRATWSGGLIDHPAILVSRVRDAADNVLGLLEARSAHHDHVDRHPDVAEHVAQTDALPSRVRDAVDHHQEVEVAVRSGRTCRHGPEHDDACRRRRRDEALHGCCERSVDGVHDVHHIAGAALSPRLGHPPRVVRTAPDTADPRYL